MADDAGVSRPTSGPTRYTSVAPVGQRPHLIALAASAGGIEALSQILSGLPPTFPVPIAIVLHRGASAPSVLPRILARQTSLNVKLAEEGDVVTAGTVYIAPADRHLQIDREHILHLLDGRKIKFVSSSANPLLDSAAASLDGRIVAVVLTGAGSNGTDGVQAVKATGGIVIAQDPVTARQAGMPRAAIATGAVDYVLPLADIAPALVKLTAA